MTLTSPIDRTQTIDRLLSETHDDVDVVGSGQQQAVAMPSKAENMKEMSEYTDYDPPFWAVEHVETPAAVSSDPVSKLSRSGVRL